MLTRERLSVQLFTLRHRLAEDPAGTFADLAGIGFTNVEPFRLMDFRETLVEHLPRYGLRTPIVGARLFGPDLELVSGLDKVFETANVLGANYVVQANSNPELWQSNEGIGRVAEALGDAADRAATHDLGVAYHNHAFEFQAAFDLGTGLDVLVSRLDDRVKLEVDTYWAYVGGVDVAQLLTRLRSRIVALHLKDGDPSRDPGHQVAVGHGVLPVRNFVRACPDLPYGVIELDNCATDPTHAVRESFAYLESA